jgi:hypothetical protein
MERNAMRKTIIGMLALAAIGLVQPTGLSARGGFGAGGGYPASFGGDNDERVNCRLVSHRFKTRHGWRIRQVQICN